MSKLTKLSQDEMDTVVYDARVGDLESLKGIFTDEVEPSVLSTIKDEFTLATPIHMAAANGHSEAVKYLLSIVSKEEAKELTNKQNESGNTALHWASYNGHIETMKVLCDFGADPFVENKFKHDCFYEVQNCKSEEPEKYLLERFGEELEAKSAEEDKQEEGEKLDESKVQFNKGTEIQKITEGGKEAVQTQKEIEDMSFLKEKTEKLNI